MSFPYKNKKCTQKLNKIIYVKISREVADTYRNSKNTSWLNYVNSASHAILSVKLFKTRNYSLRLKVW